MIQVISFILSPSKFKSMQIPFQKQEIFLMHSEGYLCHLCSEIFAAPSELYQHARADHGLGESALDFPVSDEEGESGSGDLSAACAIVDNEEFEARDSDTSNDLSQFRTEKDINVTLLNGNEKLYEQKFDPLNNNNPQNMKKPTNPTNISKKKRGRPSELIIDPLDPLTYLCQHCDFKTKIKSCIRAHRLTHTMDCPFCLFKTVRKNYLTEHIKAEHLDEQGCLKGPKEEASINFFAAELASSPSPLLATAQDPGFSYLRPVLRPSIITNHHDVRIVDAALKYLNYVNSHLPQLI